MLVHHGAGVERANTSPNRFPCHRCELQFTQSDRLARHNKTVHADATQKCPLPSCSRTINRTDNLVPHIVRHFHVTQRSRLRISEEELSSWTYHMVSQGWELEKIEQVERAVLVRMKMWFSRSETN